MKKIKESGAKQKSSKEKTLIGVIIGLLMVFSVLGYFGSQNGSSVFRYNGLKFTQMSSGMLALKFQGASFRFNFLPNQLNTTPGAEAVPILKGKNMIYSTSDPVSPASESIAEAEFLFDEALANAKIYPVPGFIAPTQSQRKVITCLNATETVPVVFFEQRNESAVKLFGNCVKITAPTRLDFLAIKDRIIFGILGIL
jgi:hypothetical protein